MRQAEMFPKIRAGLLRPTVPQYVPQWMKDLISRQWDNCPTHRLSFDDCIHVISKNTGQGVNAFSIRKNASVSSIPRPIAVVPEVLRVC
jgi:hypothetical protein